MASAAFTLPAVRVQYYRQMKPRRVYPLVVRWAQPPASGARPGNGAAVHAPLSGGSWLIISQ